MFAGFPATFSCDAQCFRTFAEMTSEKRPQDPHMDGTSLRFETLDRGGEYPDTSRKRSN
jgi:hypothetical protein